MKATVTRMFNEAYRERFPLFGLIPTQCVVVLNELISTGSDILDLGCGDGRDSLFLLDHGHSVVAMDLSEAAIASLKEEAARRNYSDRLVARVADVASTELGVGTFDAVIGITILDHLDQSGYEMLIERAGRALKVGGVVAWEMHSDRDPGLNGHGVERSEFSSAIESVASRNILLKPYLRGWRVLAYSDRIELDTDHGAPHHHGFCTLLAQKEE